MNLAVRAPLHKAQDVLEELARLGVLDPERIPRKEGSDLLVPIIRNIEEFDVIEAKLSRRNREPSLAELLEERLGTDVASRVKTAHDVVGDIAIMEIDRDLDKHRQAIAQALLDANPRIRTVVRKQGAHEGELRVQDYEVLAGEDTTETTSIENGVRLHMDIANTYYSVRSSTERKRIADLVADGERVLVMFSGAGPFTCVIAANTAADRVVGVELNADAHLYAEENIKRNKLANAVTYRGDVRDVVPDLKDKFDRVIMPLPHTASDFLDVACTAIKDEATIHLYHFSTEEEVKAFSETIPARLKELGVTGAVEHIQKCGNLAPGVHRWCLDIALQGTRGQD